MLGALHHLVSTEDVFRGVSPLVPLLPPDRWYRASDSRIARGHATAIAYPHPASVDPASAMAM